MGVHADTALALVKDLKRWVKYYGWSLRISLSDDIIRRFRYHHHGLKVELRPSYEHFIGINVILFERGKCISDKIWTFKRCDYEDNLKHVVFNKVHHLLALHKIQPVFKKRHVPSLRDMCLLQLSTNEVLYFMSFV